MLSIRDWLAIIGLLILIFVFDGYLLAAFIILLWMIAILKKLVKQKEETPIP